MRKKVVLILLVLAILLVSSASFVSGGVSGGVKGCQAWWNGNLGFFDCSLVGAHTVCTDSSGNPVYKNGLPVLCVNPGGGGGGQNDNGQKTNGQKTITRKTPKSLDSYAQDSYDYMQDCLADQAPAGVNPQDLKNIEQRCVDLHYTKVQDASNLAADCGNTCDRLGFIYEDDCDYYCEAYDRQFDAWSRESIVDQAINDWESNLDLPECKLDCTAWYPTNENCRGGYQKRSCSCVCTTCVGDGTNRKLCPTSAGGFPNIPQPGSYLYADPKTGAYTISTQGEYYADFVDVYLGETDGKLYLITEGGQHIQGIGLHVGEPDATLTINTPPNVTLSTVQIIGAEEFADTTVTKTKKGFALGFNVKKYAPIGQKEILMNLIQDGQLVESIPLVADVQPAKESFLPKKRKAKLPKERISFMSFLGFIFLSVIISVILKKVIGYLIRKRSKKETTAWGKTSLLFGILSLFFGNHVFGLALAITAVSFSKIQKKHTRTKIATLGFVIGIIGIIMHVIGLMSSM